jgi:hypothetical protein
MYVCMYVCNSEVSVAWFVGLAIICCKSILGLMGEYL